MSNRATYQVTYRKRGGKGGTRHAIVYAISAKDAAATYRKQGFAVIKTKRIR